jgi:type IV secretory pathway VirB10-like protein
MRNLFFRINPALGIRKLRQEVWIAAAVILGIALLVCVEVGDVRRSQAKAELVMENETFVKAGERILPVNKEIWDLVEGSPEPQKAAEAMKAQGDGQKASPGKASVAMLAARLGSPAPPVASAAAPIPSTAPAAPVPHFPAVGKKAAAATAPAASGSSENTAVTTTNYAVPYANLNSSSLSFDPGALSLSKETVQEAARDLGLVKGSGVAYRRLDDQAIQSRDSVKAQQITGLQIGTTIDAELITGIISGAPAKVFMLVKRDVVSREMVVIPAGAVLLGTAAADYKAGRIGINVEWLICGNAEIKISGLVYDASGQAGLADRRINAAARKLIPAFFAGVLAEFGRVFSGQQAVIPEVALTKASETNPAMQVLVNGTGGGLDAVARVLAEQAAQEGTVIIVNPGKLIKIILLEKIPFDILVGFFGSRVR